MGIRFFCVCSLAAAFSQYGFSSVCSCDARADYPATGSNYLPRQGVHHHVAGDQANNLIAPTNATQQRNCLGNMDNRLLNIENRSSSTIRLIEDLVDRVSEIRHLMEDYFVSITRISSENMAVSNQMQDQINRLRTMIDTLSMNLTGNPAIQNDQP